MGKKWKPISKVAETDISLPILNSHEKKISGKTTDQIVILISSKFFITFSRKFS